MAILGIEVLRFGVEDIPACDRFFGLMGLNHEALGDGGHRYRLPEGHSIEVYPIATPDLPSAVKPGPCLREFVYSVSDASDLDQIGSELSNDRAVQTGASGIIRSTDDSGYGIAFRLSSGICQEWERPRFNSPSFAERIDQRVEFKSDITVRRLSHVTFFVPDSQAAERFYVDRLDFRVTDRYQGLGSFMRAAGDPAHHTLFAMTAPNQSGVDHFSFEVDDFTDVLAVGSKLTKAGWQTSLGPGRHIIGSNWFWYVKSPLGASCEIMADFDHLTDDWIAKDFPNDTPIAHWMDTSGWTIFEERMRGVRHQ